MPLCLITVNEFYTIRCGSTANAAMSVFAKKRSTSARYAYDAMKKVDGMRELTIQSQSDEDG